jgi:hypothetical protein
MSVCGSTHNRKRDIQLPAGSLHRVEVENGEYDALLAQRQLGIDDDGRGKEHIERRGAERAADRGANRAINRRDCILRV